MKNTNEISIERNMVIFIFVNKDFRLDLLYKYLILKCFMKIKY